jgi:hypothetical protein
MDNASTSGAPKQGGIHFVENKTPQVLDPSVKKYFPLMMYAPSMRGSIMTGTTSQ